MYCHWSQFHNMNLWDCFLTYMWFFLTKLLHAAAIKQVKTGLWRKEPTDWIQITCNSPKVKSLKSSEVLNVIIFWYYYTFWVGQSHTIPELLPFMLRTMRWIATLCQFAFSSKEKSEVTWQSMCTSSSVNHPNWKGQLLKIKTHPPHFKWS